MRSKPVVHMIGNAHIDPVWLWRVGEGRAEVLSTCRSALERMAETPGFVFTSGGAVTYRWVQEDDPALLAAIQQHVAEGRWSLVNGWWIQPDCNIPCGESFVRHGLYGQRALEEIFGRRAVTGYNVDSFGHAGSLPQILHGCGLINYVFFRPAPGREKDLPGTLFWWESDDGTRVLTSRPPLHYGGHTEDMIARIDQAAAQTPEDVGHVMCFYGVGNHGGGPTRANLASILQAMARPDGPEVRFGSTDRFFEIVRASGAALPVLHDELQHHARGCYTAVSKIKWHNRKCEHALLTAEKYAALAHRLCDAAYPRQALTRAWEKVLFNQFHDIMAGTSIHEACQDAYEDYTEIQRTAGQALDDALDALSGQVDTRGEGCALLAFNPLPWAQHVPVEAAVVLTRHWNEDWRGEFRPAVVHLADEQGQAVPCQVTGIEHSGGHYLLHFCFQAGLPALGYRCYHLTIPEDAPTWEAPVSQPVTSIENERLRLAFDPQSGWLTSLFDKEQGVELLRAPGGVPLVIDDPSDTWSHDVASFDEVIGCFHANGNVALVESGPVRQVVRVCSRWAATEDRPYGQWAVTEGHPYGQWAAASDVSAQVSGDRDRSHEERPYPSLVTLDYILYAGDDQVYLNLTVDWHEQLKMLKLAFPLALGAPQSTSSIPYGRIQRVDDGDEEPCQSWVDVSGTTVGAGLRTRPHTRPYGFSLLNDCKYGYDVRDGELRMSILRSPVFAFHMPRQIEPGVTYHYTDQGEQVVHLALVPHAGTWVEGDTVRRAESLNVPPIVRQVEAHDGPWPAAASLVCCSAPNVVLTVVKLAEEGKDLIVRGYETAGRETCAEVCVRLGGPSQPEDKSWPVTWKPHEIKTLRFASEDTAPVEVNMLEEEKTGT